MLSDRLLVIAAIVIRFLVVTSPILSGLNKAAVFPDICKICFCRREVWWSVWRKKYGVLGHNVNHLLLGFVQSGTGVQGSEIIQGLYRLWKPLGKYPLMAKVGGRRTVGRLIEWLSLSDRDNRGPGNKRNRDRHDQFLPVCYARDGTSIIDWLVVYPDRMTNVSIWMICIYDCDRTKRRPSDFWVNPFQESGRPSESAVVTCQHL